MIHMILAIRKYRVSQPDFCECLWCLIFRYFISFLAGVASSIWYSDFFTVSNQYFIFIVSISTCAIRKTKCNPSICFFWIALPLNLIFFSFFCNLIIPLTNILPILFLYLNTVTVTTGTFEPYWEREVWRLKIWFNPPFL